MTPNKNKITLVIENKNYEIQEVLLFMDNKYFFDDISNFDSLKVTKSRDKKNSSDDFLNDFNIKPLELEHYLRKYVIDQGMPVQILATKVCTHFNRIRMEYITKSKPIEGNIKNNILLLGPTGVGKTFIIKLIAEKLQVPFVKGDATKFSETGYIGGDVDDLVRNLYYKSGNSIEKAETGIIYVDEVDKIASMGTRGNGPDVSRGGVQRSLLKLMEESEVDIKTPHDIASQMESVMSLQKTGKLTKKRINTKNILFFFSGAFDNLDEIIKKRLNKKVIGFKQSEKNNTEYKTELYKHVIPDDLIKYGFESEFVGRIPMLIPMNELHEDSYYKILRNPNSSIILSKKRDFRSYGIKLDFTDPALKLIANMATDEKTGARSLIRIVEKTLVLFERLLPSLEVDTFTVTKDIVRDPEEAINKYIKKSKLEKIVKELIIKYGLETNMNK